MAGAPRRRIVVADNDPAALDLACVDLGLEGHDIVGRATDGTRAIELVATLAPDVLVVDHRMPPGPHGLEVARHVSEHHPDVRVIVYSNYQDRELIQAVVALGVQFLPKGNLRRLRKAVLG